MHKILYIHQDGKYTGSAISLSYLIRHLDRTRYAPWVLMAEEGSARQLFETAGARVEVVLFPRFWTSPGPSWYSRAAWNQLLFFFSQNSLRKRVLEIRPALIHVNDKSAAPAGWALGDLKIPILQHLRSSYYPTLSRFNKWLSIHLIRQFSNALIAISEDEIDGFEALPHEVIFNSIDLEQAAQARERRALIRAKRGIAEHDFLVGHLSVVSPVRGIWNFLEMAKGIASSSKTFSHSNPILNYKFMVVGSLPEAAILKTQIFKKAEKTGLADRIIFTDFQQDSLGYLAAFDVLVVCNEHGVLGRPPLEALGVGTPSVAFSGHSGKSRVLVDGLTAKIVKRGDVSALAKAVSYLAENPVIHAKMRENALIYAKDNFSPEINANKIMAVYERLLNNHA